MVNRKAVDRIKEYIYEKIRSGQPLSQYDIYDILDEIGYKEAYLLCIQATNLSRRECWSLFGSKAGLPEPPLW